MFSCFSASIICSVFLVGLAISRPHIPWIEQGGSILLVLYSMIVVWPTILYLSYALFDASIFICCHRGLNLGCSLWDCRQCDQIGLFLNDLGDKFWVKSSPNHLATFSFLNNSLKYKNIWKFFGQLLERLGFLLQNLVTLASSPSG